MSRVLLAVCAVLLAVGPARAADPQPLWEIDTAQPKMQPRGVNWVGFSPDGKTLVALLAAIPDHEKGVRGNPEAVWRLVAWDAATHKEKWNVGLGQNDLLGYVRTCAITDDGWVIVPGIAAAEVRLADGKCVELKGKTSASVGVWFDAKSRRAVWLRDPHNFPEITSGELPVLDKNGERAAAKWTSDRILEPLMIETSAVSPDGKMVLLEGQTSDDSNRERLRPWTLTSKQSFQPGELVNVPGTPRARVSSIAFSPDGKTLALGSARSSVSLWDVTKPEKEWKPYETIPAGNFDVHCLAFSPDGRTLAAGTTDRKQATLYMIDVRGGKLVSSRKLSDAVMSLAYSHDGKLFVTGHNRGAIRVWDAAAMRDH